MCDRQPAKREMSGFPLLTVVLKLFSATRNGSGIPAELTLELVDMSFTQMRCRFQLIAEGAFYQDYRGIHKCNLVEFVEAVNDT